MRVRGLGLRGGKSQHWEGERERVCVCARESERESGVCLIRDVFETVEDPVEPSSRFRF